MKRLITKNTFRDHVANYFFCIRMIQRRSTFPARHSEKPDLTHKPTRNSEELNLTHTKSSKSHLVYENR